VQEAILYGSKGEEIEFFYDHGGRRSFSRRPFEGVIGELERDYEAADFYGKEKLERFINLIPCPECSGARLRKEMLWVRVGGLNINEVSRMTIEECAAFFNALELPEKEQEIAGRYSRKSHRD
jgi:excinuclease ABC subunit A